MNLDTLQKLNECLYWNQNKIDNYSSPSEAIKLFHSDAEIQRKITFHKQVRERLLKRWNKELDRLKYREEVRLMTWQEQH